MVVKINDTRHAKTPAVETEFSFHDVALCGFYLLDVSCGIRLLIFGLALIVLRGSPNRE
jgi:hypothetical protein